MRRTPDMRCALLVPLFALALCVGVAQPAQPMLTCAHCGTHLPRDEALPGRGGVFCDAAHRAAFETAHPDS